MSTNIGMTRTLFAVATIGLSVSCASVDGTSAEAETAGTDEVVKTPAVIYEATPGLTVQQRFRQALQLLEAGNPGQAQAELLAYVDERPRSKIARDLLAQIDKTAEYFPAESFQVVLESGESLSTLSKKYLGSVYKFYALARYNNIEVPRNTRIGQAIQIPLTPEAIAAQQADSSIDEQDDTNVAESSEATGAESDASSISDAADTVTQAANEAAPPAPATVGASEQFAQFVDAGEYEQAIAMLQDIPKLSAEGQQLAILAYLSSADELEAAADNAGAANHFVSAAELLQTTGESDRALDAYRSAVNLSPADVVAADKYASLRKELANKYHREASMAFRAQELDTAISIWDRVLEIDENHANAKVYRAQALELKDRLSSLKE